MLNTRDVNQYAPPAHGGEALPVEGSVEDLRRVNLKVERNLKGFAILGVWLAIAHALLVIAEAPFLTWHELDRIRLGVDLLLNLAGLGLVLLSSFLLFTLRARGRVFYVTWLAVAVTTAFTDQVFPPLPAELTSRSARLLSIVLQFAPAFVIGVYLFSSRTEAVFSPDYRRRVVAATPHLKSGMAWWLWALILSIVLFFGASFLLGFLRARR